MKLEDTNPEYFVVKEILESYIEFIDMVLNDNKEIVKSMAIFKKNELKPILDDVNARIEMLEKELTNRKKQFIK